MEDSHKADENRLAKHGITSGEWKEFCAIQQAEWLIVDDGSIARCLAWKESGNSDDAWT